MRKSFWEFLIVDAGLIETLVALAILIVMICLLVRYH